MYEQDAKHILLIDDDAIVRRLLHRIFSSVNSEINIWQAEHGLDALNLDEEILNNLNLIVTDWQMPIMNGADFIYNFQKSYENTPILIFTGSAHEVDFVNFQEKYSHLDLSLLTKPSLKNPLLEKVCHFLK